MPLAWDRLGDAYGTAEEVPKLLETVASAKGRKADRAWEDLWSRVLHQGTIYSASPAAASSLIAMLPGAGPEVKFNAYQLLVGFAEAARQSFRDGRAIACHSGGDPEHARGIQHEILEGRPQFAIDLGSGDARVRAAAAELLTAFPGCPSADLVRDRYLAEKDDEVRGAMLTGLSRLGAAVQDWPAFLRQAVEIEQDAGNRFTALHALAMTGERDPQTLRLLAAAFVEMWPGESALFPDASSLRSFTDLAHGLGAEEHRALLLQALEASANPAVLRILAEHLLRSAFADNRSGWESVSYGFEPEGGPKPQRSPMRQLMGGLFRSLGWLLLMKLCPPLWRWKLNRPRKGTDTVEYWGLKGEAPELPPVLSAPQRDLLLAMSGKPELWRFRTNLWQAFGLPETAQGLRELASR